MEVLERPEATSSPIRPNKKLSIVVAGMFGFCLSILIVFIINYFKSYSFSKE